MNTYGKLKRFLQIVSVIIIIIIVFLVLLIMSRDSNLINDVKKFIDSDTKVLYISNKENYSKYPIELFEKYDIEYFYVNSSNLTNFEKVKIERLVEKDNLSNLIVIFKNGKVIDSLINYKEESKLNEFLQKYNIIPSIIGNIENIFSDVEALINEDLYMLYIPYISLSEVFEQDQILKELSETYNINYKKIDAYLLSNTQKEKLNTILQISKVEDQIIILIKDKKIIGSIRGINKKSIYLDSLNEYNFIENKIDYINYIDYDEFKNIIKSNEKSIVVIGKDECKYCDQVISILNPIIINYDISINYINIKNFDSEISKSLEKDLIYLGYSDGFTTPITFIFESNKILDYIIGTSSEQYFIDIFKENGIIK